MTIRLADSKGRVLLGRQFANVMFIVDDADPGQIVLKPAVAIPAREARLYENETALSLVRRGLDEARKRKLSAAAPNLKADARLFK